MAKPPIPLAVVGAFAVGAIGGASAVGFLTNPNGVACNVLHVTHDPVMCEKIMQAAFWGRESCRRALDDTALSRAGVKLDWEHCRNWRAAYRVLQQGGVNTATLTAAMTEACSETEISAAP